MAIWDEIARGLAHAQEEAARHITLENINRGYQIARDGIGHAAEQINQHVTAENMNHGIQIAREGFNNAAQQINQHVTTENINHGIQLARDGIGNAAEQISQHVTMENINRAAEEVGKAASGPAALQVANAVKQNPVPFAVAGAGIFITAVPSIITGPIMGIAGLMGFTSEDIAAASIASGTQAGIGSVAAESAFAVMQSAAAGGYGLGILTGIVQTVGGVTAAVGSIGAGLLSWLSASAT